MCYRLRILQIYLFFIFVASKVRIEEKELVKEKIVWSDFAVGNLEGKKYLWSTCYV